jgi:hypothetical protein
VPAREGAPHGPNCPGNGDCRHRQRGHTPPHAASGGHTDLGLLQLTRASSLCDTPLHLAARVGAHKVVALLIAASSSSSPLPPPYMPLHMPQTSVAHHRAGRPRGDSDRGGFRHLGGPHGCCLHHHRPPCHPEAQDAAPPHCPWERGHREEVDFDDRSHL